MNCLMKQEIRIANSRMHAEAGIQAYLDLQDLSDPFTCPGFAIRQSDTTETSPRTAA
jgi:hypothetical protein